MIKDKDNGKKIDVDFVEEEQAKESTSTENEKEETSKKEDSTRKETPAVDKQIAEYEKKIQDLEEQILRLKAEFINYKRRVEREQSEFADYVKGEIFKKILPILDDFKLMMEKAEAGKNEGSILEGARMIYDKFIQILEKEGLERIESLGKKFDPEIHEALIMKSIPDEDKHEHVVEVFQEGYKLKDKLLRPSKVIVGRFDRKETSEAQQDKN